MMENYTEIPVELNKPDSCDMEEMQKKLIRKKLCRTGKGGE